MGNKRQERRNKVQRTPSENKKGSSNNAQDLNSAGLQSCRENKEQETRFKGLLRRTRKVQATMQKF
jgi:hypothetical protein